MQRLLIFFLLATLMNPLAYAQLDPNDQKKANQAAFQLTKATVEFVATDTKTYGNRRTTSCPDCTDYPSLIRFITVNKLTKADELVRDAQKQVATLMTPTATLTQVLNGLQRFLHDRVTKGDKSGRLTLPSYKTYAGQMTQILASAGADPENLASEPAIPTPVADVPADTMDTDELAVPVGSVTKADTGIFSYGGLALLLSLLNTAGLAYLWSLRGKKTKAAPQSDGQLAEVSGRMLILERERKDLLNRMTRLERATAPPDRPATAPEPRRTLPAEPAPTRSVPPPPMSESTQPVQAVAPMAPSSVTAPQTPQPGSAPQSTASNSGVPSNQPRRRDVVLYGRTADLGDGFSVAGLLDTPDRDTVFQIEVRTESQATYRITEEPGAQQLALSDPYSYLADACEYMAKPMPNARIRTTQPGQLALQGDKWKIVEKAKISFY